MISKLQKFAIQFIALLMLLSANVAAQSISVPFDSPDWQMINAEVVEFDGKQTLMGTAVLKDVEFQSGIIEVDIYATGKRSYPGVIFRVQNMQNYERFYTRPHRAGLYPDALQYVPVFNGIAGWQLYNGEGYTAGAALPDSQWVHFKFEISDKQVKVFWGENKEPGLVINDLKHGISKGSLGLFGPKDRTAYFANFSYKADDNLKFESVPEKSVSPGVIRDWELSQAFKINQIDFEKHFSEQGISSINWQKVKTEPAGLLDISRYYGMSSQVGSAVFAKTTIVADKDQTLNLQFGYSDAVSIFLNGKHYFFGNSSYRQRDPSFLGIIGLHDAVYLPLRKGENELLFIVGESFGGWGIMARDGNAEMLSPELTEKWEIYNRLQFPESIVYDKKRECLYTSNYFNDGREYITKLKLDGEIEEMMWIQGLRRPTGLYLYEDRLYAVDRTGLNVIHIDSAKIVERIPIPGARFLNDIAVSEAGHIYVSDNAANKIFKIQDGKSEVWLENAEIVQPNGLLIDGDYLIVGTTGDGCLKSVGLEDKEINTIACIGQGSVMDGIQIDGDGNYLISDFNGRVFRISTSGEKTELLNRVTPKKYCCDFVFIIEKNLLIIPSIWDNRLTAYEMKK